MTKREECRLCLSDKPIYDFCDPSCPVLPLKDAIEQMFSLCILTTRSGASSMICFNCVKLVEEYYEFYTKVQENQRLLKLRKNKFKPSAKRKSNIISTIEYESENVRNTSESIDNEQNESIDCKEFCEVNISKEMLSNRTDLPKKLIENGKFVIRGSALERVANTFFNMECSLCLNKPKFDSLAKLLDHFPAEHGKKGFVTCCEKNLFQKSIIYMHMARHLQPSAFECPICKKEFTRLGALKPHLEIHLPESERSYKCDECGRCFAKKPSLNYHKLTHIPKEQKKSYSCELCSKIFTSTTSLLTHVTLVHSKPKYLCSECGKSFKYQQSFSDHLDTHDPNGSKKVQCQICGSICKNKKTLQLHSRRHSSVRSKCLQCDYSTPRKSSLKQHMLVKHSNHKPYVCNVCGKRFKLNIILRDHMAQHTGERKYSCPFCPKEFASSGNYYSHRKKMHGEEHKRDKMLKQRNAIVATETSTNENYCITQGINQMLLNSTLPLSL